MSNTIRDTAINNARALAQDIFERDYTQDNYQTTYYLERDGSITRDDHIGTYERESVYYDHGGCAARLLTIGRNGVGYNGDETDYRDMDAERAVSAEAVGRAGREYGDHIRADDLPAALTAQYEDGLYWDGETWRPLSADVCDWHSRDISDPSDALVDAIEALPADWFAAHATAEAE